MLKKKIFFGLKLHISSRKAKKKFEILFFQFPEIPGNRDFPVLKKTREIANSSGCG